MVREDILGGLELAMSRGETLEQAMYTFYNAGYKKEDIEEAARVLVQQNPQPQNQPQNQFANQQQNIPSQQIPQNNQQPLQQDNQIQDIPQQTVQQSQQTPEQPGQIQPRPLPQQQLPAQQPKKKSKGFFKRIFGKIFSKKQKPKESNEKNQAAPEKNLQQKSSGISNYGQTAKKPKRNVKRIFILSILVLLLFILLGSLIGIFIFREIIVDFLNSVLS